MMRRVASGATTGPKTQSSLPRPQRSEHASDKAFDKAFIIYQDVRMKELGEQYPKARCGAPIWHGSDFPPEVVLSQGLPAKKGDNYDLVDHQQEFSDPDKPDSGSALRGGCLDCRIPGGMAGEGGYVYLIQPRGRSVSLSQALAENDLLPAESELSFGARQPPEQIVAWRRVGKYSDVHEAYRLGEQHDNPGFDPKP